VSSASVDLDEIFLEFYRDEVVAAGDDPDEPGERGAESEAVAERA